MRILLSDTSKAALVRIQARCSEINPATESAAGPFLIRFISAIESILSKDEWPALAEKMTSERIKRKRIEERLLRLGEKLDESDIDKFERKIERKIAVSNSDSVQKTAENS